MITKNIDFKKLMKHYKVMGLSITTIENYQVSNTECFGLLEAGTDRLVNKESIFNACSISKFLTSVLVQVLTEKGILELDKDVNDMLKTYQVPENEMTKLKKVTLRNLLSHQSGIVDPDGSFGELENDSEIPSIVDLLNGKTSYCSVSIEVKSVPGSDFQYADAGYCIIEQLIEDVTSEPFDKLMNELIFQPLSMNNSTYVSLTSQVDKDAFSCGHDKYGDTVKGKYTIYPFPATAGLWTTPTDLAILVTEIMNSLKGESKIGLSESKAKEMISPQGDKKWTGLGVFLDTTESGLEISSLGWGVGFQSMLVAYPSKGTGFVIMTNTDLGVHQMKGIIGEIYHSLSK